MILVASVVLVTLILGAIGWITFWIIADWAFTEPDEEENDGR
jgi:hypothetical protein